MNSIFALLKKFLKSPTTRMFVFLIVLLGALISFMNNDHLQKTNINKKNSKINTPKTYTSNKLSKIESNTENEKNKNPYVEHLKKFVPDNYKKPNITGEAANIKNPLLSKENNLKGLKTGAAAKIKSPEVCPSCPLVSGYAVPCPTPKTFTMLFPPPFVVVAGTPAAPPPPPPPPPIPEPSSMILGLIGLSGILGLRKKMLLK